MSTGITQYVRVMCLCWFSDGNRQDNFYIPGLPGGTRAGAGRIGRQIADEMLESSRYTTSISSLISTPFV